jgi:sulfur-carrier protein adenylyltransferase/sulfurtransferase
MEVNNTITKEEIQRYSRHFSLPGFGYESQLQLKKAQIAVVGAGGLGCPVLQYLTAAGVGSIVIIDHDIVSLSNLQRQVLYTTDDIGKSKSETAARRLSQLNPNVKLSPYTSKITSANALTVLKDCHLVVDCTDNFPTRYLINDACVLLGIPFIYGSIFRYEGQVSVFNYKNGPDYRSLYPVPPAPGSMPDCEEGGVLGVLPGIIGSLQSNEVIKILTGIGEPLSGKLLIYDALNSDMSVLSMSHRPQKEIITKLIDYEDFCGLNQNKDKTWQPNNSSMKEITVQDLKGLIDTKADFQLIDVREPHEYDICNIGGELIPMADLPHHVAEISRDKKVVVHCRSGKRSGDMVLWLEKNHGLENLYNLKGGILAWAKEIDPTMPTY